MPDPVLLGGLEEIHERFDGLIVDQWGVVHDGSALFADALDTLRALRAHGTRIVLLSNTGRRLAQNLQQLRRMGLGDDQVDGVVTSGETAFRMLRSRQPPFETFGRRCLLWSEGREQRFLDGLDLEPVARAQAADFVLLAGIPCGVAPEDLRPELEAAAARQLPMICCNPDRVVVVASGVIPATGSVARLYEDVGGVVHYVGKPHMPVYRACLDLLRPIPHMRILAIGDSLEHDIGGGAGAGLATALVLSGIHAGELGPDPARPGFRRDLERLSLDHGASPTFVLPCFTWTNNERSAR